MSILDYAGLQSVFPDNVSGLILPSHVRSLVDSISTRFIVATYDPGAPVNPTPTTPTKLPLTKYGTAGTNGISEASNIITLRDVGLYVTYYRISGYCTTAAIPNLRLYSPSAALFLAFSDVSVEQPGTNRFTLSAAYLTRTFSANTTLQVEYWTDAAEIWNDPKGFAAIFSLPPIYGGA